MLGEIIMNTFEIPFFDSFDNIILLSDSYKYSHWKSYMPNTKYNYAYLEARNGAKFNKTVMYGLQYILKRYLEGKVITKEKIDFAEAVITAHMGPGMFNRKGWDYILEKYDGSLPVKIKAVAVENSVTSLFCVCFKIYSPLKKRSPNVCICRLLLTHTPVLLIMDHFRETFLESYCTKHIYMI